MTVPSFWVTNRRASSPLLASPSAKARVVRSARVPRPALSSVTFSRPSSPMRPRSWEQVTTASGTTSRTIAATSSSAVALSGENTEQMATLRMPDSSMAFAASSAAAVSSGTIGRPVDLVAATHHEYAATHQRPEIGRPVDERLERGGGRKPDADCRNWSRPRRCTTALVKWVVPIMTASTADRSVPGRSSRRLSAVSIPEVTSSVVGVFTVYRTVWSSIRTASVLVPPTSIPIRIIARARRRPSGSPDRGRRREVPRASAPSR